MPLSGAQQNVPSDSSGGSGTRTYPADGSNVHANTTFTGMEVVRTELGNFSDYLNAVSLIVNQPFFFKLGLFKKLDDCVVCLMRNQQWQY